MAGQRNYWVVSPNVGDHQKRSEAWMVEAWKKIIRNEEVAVMGWGIDEDRKKNPQGYIMGQRFAGTDDPSVQPSIQRGDVILIARGRMKKDVVAVGVTDSDSWEDDSSWYRKLHHSETVQIRRLKPFQWLEGMDMGHLNMSLERALPSNGAMTRRPLDVKNPDIKKLCNWLDRQIENARESGASRWK